MCPHCYADEPACPDCAALDENAVIAVDPASPDGDQAAVMPERYLYVHGTCGVCGYAGGLVIASATDPRCWPCEDWAVNLSPDSTRSADVSIFPDVMTITIEKQALAFRTVCGELLADVPLRYLDEPERWEP